MPYSANISFPRTELASSLPRSFDTVKVASTEGFPSEPGFMVRIEGTSTEPSELVTVTKIAGNKWTVKRAAEGSTKVYHPPKADVELFPVRYEQRALSLDERRKALAKHPFVQPIPPRVQVAAGDDPALQTKLIMISVYDKDHIAWLLNERTRQNTVVKKGTTISVGDVNGTVVAIDSDSIQIKRGTEVWQLALGRNLRSMTRARGRVWRRLRVFRLFRRSARFAGWRIPWCVWPRSLPLPPFSAAGIRTWNPAPEIPARRRSGSDGRSRV